MDLQHEFTVPATLQETWDAFNDIASVGECFPGAQVTGVEGDTFTGTVKVKLGPIALVYSGTGTFLEKDESARMMKIQAKGKDKRGNGTAGADVLARMSDVGGGSTRVEVTTDLNITGKPAQFGRGVIQDVSDKLLGQFTACLEKKVGAQSAAESGGDSAVDTPPTEPEEAASTVAAAPAPAGGDAPVGSPASGAGSTSPASTAGSTPGGSASSGSGEDDALDLGATVLPILARTYWREGVIAVLVVLLLARGRRR